MRFRVLPIFAAMCFISVMAGADGGVLTFQQRDPGFSFKDWSLTENSRSRRAEPGTTKIAFPDGTKEEAWIFNLMSIFPRKVFVTVAEPNGLFLAAEDYAPLSRSMIYVGETLPDSEDERSGTYSKTLFRQVIVPSGSSVGDVTFVATLSVIRWASSPNTAYLQVERIHGFYEGRLSIGSKEYSARLMPSSFHFIHLESEGKVLLDSNRDGEFDHFTDMWFSANGYLFIEGEPWVSKTVVYGATAEIRLTPYTGPTGSLAIKGAGEIRTHLTFDADTEYSSRNGKDRMQRHTVCLPSSGLVYKIPVGRYRMNRTWVQANKDSQGLFVRDDQYTTFSISIGEEREMPLGGPMIANLAMRGYNSRTTTLELYFTGFRNQEGTEFFYVDPSEKDNRHPQSHAEIVVKDADGAVIANQTASTRNSYLRFALPRLAFGKMSAEISDPAPEFLNYPPISFYKTPSKEIFLLGGFVLTVPLVFLVWIVSRWLSIGRAVAFSAALGWIATLVLLHFRQQSLAIYCGSSSWSVFLSFVLWRVFRARNRFFVAVLCFLSCLQMSTFFRFAVIVPEMGFSSLHKGLFLHAAFLSFAWFVAILTTRLETQRET